MNKKTLAYFNDAMRAGDLNYINAELKKGIDLNQEDKNGLSPLLSAMVTGQWRAAERVLDAGADVDYVSRTNGFNALHHAAGNGNIDFLKILFLYKRDLKLDMQNKQGNTALHLACIKGHLNVVVFLVVAGAGLHTLNKKGLNALDLAILNNQKVIAEWLKDQISYFV
jgi:ankyrin repeat protein